VKKEEYRYGTCECGAPLSPVWFIEEEHKVICGEYIKTGRKRRACSHLECEYCGRRYPVDDTFDGGWY
jgi:hypothetical protein